MQEAPLGIDHVGIAVTDLLAAKTTYTESLGFVACDQATLPHRGLEVVFLEAGNTRIELLGATCDDSEISSFLRKRGPGIHHLCIAVENFDAKMQQLRQAGNTLIGDGTQTDAHNRRVVFVHPKSSHGVLLELVEHKTPKENQA